MLFRETPLAGAFVLEPERHEDERGGFFRSFCRHEFEKHGLDPTVAQANISSNRLAGTLRGLHFQTEPHGETKLVRCSRGRLFDVIADLRPGSATQGQWFGAELSTTNSHQLYIPRGFAHGFLTLDDDTEVSYLMGSFYQPGAGAGVRWDDPDLAIEWPRPPVVLSDRDAALPLLGELDLDALLDPETKSADASP